MIIKTNNIYLRNIIFYLILIYPFIFIFSSVFNFDYTITVPYFLFINLLITIELFFQKVNKTLIVQTLLPIYFLTIIILFGLNDINYIMPLVYSFSLILLSIYFKSIKWFGNIKSFKFFILSFFFVSTVFFVFKKGFTPDNRFQSFLLSSTTFSAYLTTMFIISILTFKSKKIITLLYIISVIFIFYSKTRLNLIFIILIPFIYIVSYRKIIKRTYIYVFFISILILAYPGYNIINKYIPQLITIRYKKTDYSYNSRINLYQLVYEDFVKGSFYQKMFGKGSEHSRILVKKEYNKDIFPHNDFIRFLNDFGIIAFLLLLYIFAQIAKKNTILLLFVLLYFLMFYNNLIYNLFIIYFLFIFQTANGQYFKINQKEK